MSLDTYSNLKSAIADWLARSDLTSGQVADLITLFESTANRTLRVRQMETTSTLTATSGVASLPSDYLTWRGVTCNASTPVELRYVHPTWLRSAFPTTDSGTPEIFTIEGSNLTVRPVQDTSTLTLRYLQKIPVLSDSNTTNWLLTAHPDCYLAGSLAAANAFLIDFPKAGQWKALRDQLFDEITQLGEKTKAPAEIQIIGTVV